mmetsp:Transcript_19192/g.40010  ORF Transcript_19192/g.40010 Transcript_19192/m.40010 type:complete len:260 (-) Transcript_19192:167-946(-)
MPPAPTATALTALPTSYFAAGKAPPPVNHFLTTPSAPPATTPPSQAAALLKTFPSPGTLTPASPLAQNPLLPSTSTPTYPLSTTISFKLPSLRPAKSFAPLQSTDTPRQTPPTSMLLMFPMEPSKIFTKPSFPLVTTPPPGILLILVTHWVWARVFLITLHSLTSHSRMVPPTVPVTTTPFLKLAPQIRGWMLPSFPNFPFLLLIFPLLSVQNMAWLKPPVTRSAPSPPSVKHTKLTAELTLLLLAYKAPSSQFPLPLK